MTNLWKKLGSKWVLQNISFTANRGEILVVLGPNGAGKTTLFRTLVGLYKPEKGEVRVAGLEPRLARRRGLLAYLPDELGLYPRLTGREHIEFYHKLYGLEPRYDLVEALGMSDALDRKVGEYSRGMRRRLEIAMILSVDANVYVLDEPLTGLDLASLRAAERVLRRVRDEGKTILLSTHEIYVAERVADRVIVLQDGRVASIVDIESVKREYGSLEAFLESRVYGGRV